MSRASDERPEGEARGKGPQGSGGLSSSSGLGAVGNLADSIQLVQRYQSRGDREALNQLFERYYERVRRIARIRMGPRLRRLTDSDDLVQNTFAVAFGKIDQLELRDHSSIIQYLSKVLENQIRGAIDYFDAQKRTPPGGRVLSTDVGTDSEAAPLEVRGDEPEPHEQVALRELRELYDACVQDLDPVHREVILLKEYADAPWSEIARVLGRPTEHAAMQLYARAQAKLAARLRQRLGS